jgi:hypothetical protein
MLVEQFYCRVLQRPPQNEQDFAYGVNYLKSHTVKDLMRDGILGDEFRNNFLTEKSDETVVLTLYDVLLSRVADPGGLAGWITAVGTLGTEPDGWARVVDSFFASAEYNRNFGDDAVPGNGRAGCSYIPV